MHISRDDEWRWTVTEWRDLTMWLVDDDEQETKKGNSLSDATQGKHRSLRWLEWLNFFLADVQTGLGPFLAAYLASSGWNPGRVGYA
ncbi:MAG TPA: hypothetical protein VN911_15550 [Candidatus Acidoferrum sp.]|nr:hypothetical protein [Candidatus Acidoferrum sp.]